MSTNPLLIENMRVRNFRGFVEREFKFHPQFNVLIGDNALGKTSAIEALAVLLSPWVKGASGRWQRNINIDDLRLVANREGGAIRLDRPFECEVQGSVGGVSVRRVRSGPSGRTSSKEAQELQKIAERMMRQAGQGHGGVHLPVVANYGTVRRRGIKESEKKQSAPRGRDALRRHQGYRDALDARVDSRLFENWLEQQAFHAFQSDGRELPQAVAVRKALANLVEGVETVRYLANAKAVVAEFEDGLVLPLDLLSDGQKGILRLAGDLAWRMVQLNPWLEDRVLTETPGVVLIDELGLHLHPNWQRRVVEQLRTTFPKIQFIATTHSPFIVQSLREGELISFDTVPVPKTDNLGVEQIAKGLMGVEDPNVGLRYMAMKAAAHSYLDTIEDESLTPEERLHKLEDELAESDRLFADNPAFQAVLERKRIARLGS